MKQVVSCPICKELYFAEEMVGSPITDKVCHDCENKKVTIDYAGSCLGCIGSVMTSIAIAIVAIIVITAIFF